MKKPANFKAIFEVLARHGVDFVLIGGVAATVHGCSTPTYDIDIVYRRSDENLQRLLAALGELEAVFALDLAGRRLAPTVSHLLTAGPKLLQTKHGRLDILGEIRPDIGFDDLNQDSVPVSLGPRVQVISLERLIDIKAWLVSLNLHERGGRDQIHLHQLRAILARRG